MDYFEGFGERDRPDMLSVAIMDFNRLVETECSSPNFALHQASGAPYCLYDRAAGVGELGAFLVLDQLGRGA
jgi:hypothetical protein